MSLGDIANEFFAQTLEKAAEKILKIKGEEGLGEATILQHAARVIRKNRHLQAPKVKVNG